MRLAKQVRNCPAPVGLGLRDCAATRRIVEVSRQQAETAALHVGPDIGSPLRTGDRLDGVVPAVVGRRPDLDLPTARCASFRPNLLRPASFIFQDRRSTAPLGTYPVMSERGLHS